MNTLGWWCSSDEKAALANTSSVFKNVLRFILYEANSYRHVVRDGRPNNKVLKHFCTSKTFSGRHLTCKNKTDHLKYM